MTTNQLDLFGQPQPSYNPLIQLPNAELLYYPTFFGKVEADQLLQSLLTQIDWQQDRIKMYGKEIPLPRLSAWYGDDNKPYTYSGIKLTPKPWTADLLRIKERIEAVAGVQFSSVLLNRYRDGKDYISWHTDAEKELGRNPVIGSVNFGAARRFQLRRIDDHAVKHEVELGHGTLLVMKGETQHFWQHQVPKTAAPIGERLNLTFRVIR
ncbi:alpha-ketoglutarate-dependent dioxygenase AlkB family protein [Fibrella arboris]|uniref:alpha-ketoglutarate-dependent dioxygenase AlkB family protein n=1 Tax=Fibrella arboris TaxID=3242486 RepID=UPI00352025C7